MRLSIYIEKNMQVLSTDFPDSPASVTTSSVFVLDIVVSFPWNMAMDKWQSVCVIKEALSSDSLLLFYIVSSPFVSNFVNLTPQHIE